MFKPEMKNFHSFMLLFSVESRYTIMQDEDDASEADAPTISEDFSLPLNLQRRLQELNIKDIYMKGTFVDLEDESVIYEENIMCSAESTDLDNNVDKICVTVDKLPEISAIIKIEKKDNKNILSHNQDPVDPNKLKTNFDQHSYEGQSDIAQMDSADGLSDDDNFSGASETGADISELKSYADDGVITVEAELACQIVEELVPEANYVVPKDNLIQSPLKPAQILNRNPIIPPAIEQGTQTDSAKKMSVMDLQTTYFLKEQALQEANPQSDFKSNINEIILDATLPIDTQLLIKDSHFGKVSSETLLDSESSDYDMSPYIVTSQVHLAFIGLEQSGSLEDTRYVIPEERESPCVRKDVPYVLKSLPVINDEHEESNIGQIIVSKPSESCGTNGVNLYTMGNSNTAVANSFPQHTSNRSPKMPVTRVNDNILIEETAKQIVKEATEESLKRLCTTKYTAILSSEPLRSVSIVEDIGNSVRHMI